MFNLKHIKPNPSLTNISFIDYLKNYLFIKEYAFYQTIHILLCEIKSLINTAQLTFNAAPALLKDSKSKKHTKNNAPNVPNDNKNKRNKWKAIKSILSQWLWWLEIFAAASVVILYIVFGFLVFWSSYHIEDVVDFELALILYYVGAFFIWQEYENIVKKRMFRPPEDLGGGERARQQLRDFKKDLYNTINKQKRAIDRKFASNKISLTTYNSVQQSLINLSRISVSILRILRDIIPIATMYYIYEDYWRNDRYMLDCLIKLQWAYREEQSNLFAKLRQIELEYEERQTLIRNYSGEWANLQYYCKIRRQILLSMAHNHWNLTYINKSTLRKIAWIWKIRDEKEFIEKYRNKR